MRRTDECINCGETREMAAHGLCFNCYRQKERADDRRFAAVDRHNPAIRREHIKLLRGFAAVMTGLSNLGISRNDVGRIRGILEPYLAEIAQFLGQAPKQNQVDSAVNSEQKED